jgi:aromatic-L-amino-acid decarboxylase
VTEFSEQFKRVAGWIEAYYDDASRFPVLSRSAPGELIQALPENAPEEGESFDAIFADFERLILPGITHWNHPRFFAYFSISSAPVAVLAEALAATLDVNAMLWRTSPAATELEDVTTAWLRDLLHLDRGLHGIVYDTASTGGFTALAAARESLGLDIRTRGMAGRSDLAPLRVYITDHTHSHIEKGAIALGVGRENVVRVAVDEAYAMRPDALAEAIDADRARGFIPMCVAATIGTTSTTSRDPIERIAEVTSQRNVWLHVDAAYAGPAAMLPECEALTAGCEWANSVVVNPHKWLFVPVDLSVLYVRDLENLRRTFSLVADYLKTADGDVRNYMDYGLQLGRRFRALKLWFVLRHYGARAIREKLREHIRLAQIFAQWVRAEAGWEVCAPHPLSVVCFRAVPAQVAPEALDAYNERLLEAVNATGEVFLSGTRLDGRFVLRLAVGNERTTQADVALAWDLLRAAKVAGAGGN